MFGITDSGQKNLGNGLIMHLDAAQKISYGGTGTVWTDLSGNNRSGSLENGPTFDSSNGGGFLFDGTNDRWKAIIGNIGTGSFTLEYVFKFINNSIYLDALCHAGVSQDGADSMGFGFATDGGNNFNFTITSRSVQLQADVLLSPVNGTIYHFTGTRQYVSSTERIAAYRNGVHQNSTTGSVGVQMNLSGSLYYTTGDARHVDTLGTYCWSYNASPTGSIYLVRLYNRALTADEVKTNYEAYKSRFGL